MSLHLGQDANWDLLNYHFYDPYAFVNDRIDWDIAPAQLQSYHNPLADVPFYWAVRADLAPRVIAVLLALPAGIALFFLWLSLEHLFGNLEMAGWRVYAALALLIGATGTAGVPLIGTTTNDWPPAMLIVTAIWLVFVSNRMSLAKMLKVVAVAGFLAGFAAGLKLTAALYAPSLSLALLSTVRPFRYRAMAGAGVFSSLAVVGFLATAGFWLWRMYDKFGNPVFPYFNDWFRSPWWDAAALDSGYGPHSAVEWVVFPFRLFRYNSGVVGELGFRDWRVPAVFVGAALALSLLFLTRIRSGRTRDHRTTSWHWRFLLVFWFSSFLLWIHEHSVYRYIIPLELFSGAMAITFLCWSLPSRTRLIGAFVVTGLIIATTIYPFAWRIPFGRHFFAVEAPKIPGDSLVLIVEDAPLAYALPFLDAGARFVGAKNNFTGPSSDHLLAKEIRKIIERHSGPLFSMQSSKGLGDEALSAYGLEKRPDKCGVIHTNMTMGPITLCELIRSSSR